MAVQLSRGDRLKNKTSWRVFAINPLSVAIPEKGLRADAAKQHTMLGS